MPDLFPPPLGGQGDHIVANNPFSDPRHSPLAPLPPQQGYPGAPHHPLGPGPPGPYNMHTKHGGGPHGPPMPQGNMPPGGAKIYPPNQSMVFNPSNPNAPPIYPCGICHKEVSQDMVHDNDQAVLCESGCNFWFHRSCTGLTEAAYQMLTQEVYAEWVCDKCLQTKNIPLVKMKP